MKHTRSHRIPPIVAGLLALFIAMPASAQYVWLDHNNVRNYSDKPPPASIPASRVLKTPRTKASSSAAQAPAGATPNGAPASATQQKPVAGKSEADKKKEQAEKDKKAAEATKQAETKAKNCEKAREYQRNLDSGQRIARMGKNGERSVLTDEQRAQEQQEVQKMLDECK